MSTQSESDKLPRDGPIVEVVSMMADDGVEELADTRNKREPEFIARNSSVDEAKYFNESYAMTSSIFPAPEIPSPMVSFLNPSGGVGGTDEEASPQFPLVRQVVRQFESTEERPSVAPVAIDDELD